MKKTILTSLLVGFSLLSFAQNAEELKPTKNYQVGSFQDNWFISAGVGVQTYVSENYFSGSLLGHFSPAVDLSIGKWFTPVMGVRAQFSGFNLRGYNSLVSDYVSGVANEDGVYEMGFGYFNIHGDFLFNLHSQFAEYNPNRCYELIPFVGFGLASSFDISEKIVNPEFAASAGLINQFRINERLDIDLELKATVIKSIIDGNSAKYINIPMSATVGVTYKIGKENEFKYASVEPIIPVVEAPAVDNSANQALQNQNNQLSKSLAEQQKKNNDLANSLNQEKQRANQLNSELDALKKAPKVEAVNVNGNFRVFYTIGKTTLDEFNSANLEYIADMIKKSNRKFVIKGYADKTTGKLSVNQKIANKRAQNVYNLLTEKYGVSKDILSIESYVINPAGNPALVRMAEIK